jgi:UPF0755 protein
LKKVISGIVLALLIGLVITASSLARMAQAPGPLARDVLIYIPPGSSGVTIAATLEKAGVIQNTLSFLLMSRFKQRFGPLRAGEYLFPKEISLKDAVALLQSGKTHARFLTMAEGLTSRDIVAILLAAEGLKGALDVMPPEGSLLPETYYYSFGDSRAALMRRMSDDMVAVVGSLWAGRDPDLPLKTPAEAIVLASIVEKETGVSAERARVAGVFINRLKIGMPLQSDPTVIYALTQGKKDLGRPLLRKDLEFSSPFNTYVVNGLPPRPIAHPGRASIAAVMKPEKHDFLYFVADGTGGHAFGRTLAEHNENVRRWRALQR